MFRLNMDPYGSVPTKRPDDGSVEPKHVALNVFFYNKLDVFDCKNLHFVCIQEHIGMTNVKSFTVTLQLFNDCYTEDVQRF